jgi:hypothetical protein
MLMGSRNRKVFRRLVLSYMIFEDSQKSRSAKCGLVGVTRKNLHLGPRSDKKETDSGRGLGLTLSVSPFVRPSRVHAQAK